MRHRKTAKIYKKTAKETKLSQKNSAHSTKCVLPASRANKQSAAQIQINHFGKRKKYIVMPHKAAKEYIDDSQVVKRANAAVRIEIEKQNALGNPIAVFDRKTQMIYYQGSDGTRTIAGKRIRRGRYSERLAEET